MKPKIKCPACKSERIHTYTVPNHPELKGTIEIMAQKYEGITITRLVTCADCGNVYDSVVAKKFVGGSHKKREKGDKDRWLEKS